MLEIKDLVKVYKAKGGAEVRALDGVSIRFEEKGMVFLLGKSGSGKSTLLNLCGGLDTPDEGEIIIKGRSSKDFSQSDFDSYRNTFVGFVFQEYNILDEFSVEDNIALALELQGKNKNKEAVNAILEQVDLTGFAKRKPNTLSGGQKQRVAIARALVKNPEIIMADEPTGALDSTTGKQVFDTLKKLSREKLVIVVSHDREFAEIYGDRIIELKDGKIISDVTKTKIEARKASDNLSFVGDDTISIRSGSKLTAHDIDRINAFLAASAEDVIITNGKKEISDFRKAARIDKEGARESFRDTDENAIAERKYTPQDSRFIRSKLPARHAIRIGASSMKVKPFRLLFTILLSFVAFTMFGLFSTLTFYDKTATALETYLDSGYQTLLLSQNYSYEHVSYMGDEETGRYTTSSSTQFTPDDLAACRSQYGDAALGIFNYSSNNYGNTFSVANVTSGSDFNTNYYNYELKGFAQVDATSSWSEKLLTDTDLSSLGENDIVISSYTFDSLQEATLYSDADRETTVQLNSYEDIVGEVLYLENYYGTDTVALTVRGVFESDLPAQYDELITQQGAQENTAELTASLQAELEYGIYQYALVSPDFYEAHVSEFSSEDSEYVDYGFTSLDRSLRVSNANDSTEGSYIYQAAPYPPEYGETPDHVAFFSGQSVSALSEGQIILPFSVMQNQIYDMISTTVTRQEEEASALEDQGYEKLNEYDSLCMQSNDLVPLIEQAQIEGNTELVESLTAQREELERQAEAAYDEYESLVAQAETMRTAARDWRDEMDTYVMMLSNGSYDAYIETEDGGYYTTLTATEEQLSEAADAVLQLIEDLTDDAEYEYDPQYTFVFEDMSQEYGTFRAVGFYYGVMNRQNNGVYFSQSDYDALTDIANESDLLESENIVSETDDTFFTINSLISTQLSMVNSTIDMLWQVFLWVGVVMAVFAMLLLFNFISVSISYKKKEIGILRAVGARSTDVFKIFYSESIIITAICFVLAMIASFVVCNVLNTSLAGTIGASIFVFGPLSWLVMLGIAVVTSFIATFLPVYSIAKRKPVESIRAL